MKRPLRLNWLFFSFSVGVFTARFEQSKHFYLLKLHTVLHLCFIVIGRTVFLNKIFVEDCCEGCCGEIKGMKLCSPAYLLPLKQWPFTIYLVGQHLVSVKPDIRNIFPCPNSVYFLAINPFYRNRHWPNWV